VQAPKLLQADLRNRTQGESTRRKKLTGVSIDLKNNKEFNTSQQMHKY
jgi:hypothetical protein